jgi:hypothetical protein
MGKTLAFVLVGLSVLGGCAASPPAPKAVASHSLSHAHDASDHNHDRGQMMIASDGFIDALLTAHLSSKTGNELDVFVEKAGTPLALTTTELRATAVVGGAPQELAFECAPRDERPADEVDGTCSHFVARAPWVRPGEPIRVATTLPLRRGDIAYVWRGFEALRYAHHVE